MKDSLEEDWISPEGYRCVVRLHHAAGHRMGYIFIPATDKAYVEPVYETYDMGGKEFTIMKYNEMYDIEVHGGLTYGEVNSDDKTYPATETRDGVWLGFDCAHCDDKPDFDAWEALYEEDDDKTALDMLRDVEDKVWTKTDTGDHRHMWTKQDVAEECNSMSRQIYIMTKGKLDEQD